MYSELPRYRPTEEERLALVSALETAQAQSTSLREWAEVREILRSRHY